MYYREDKSGQVLQRHQRSRCDELVDRRVRIGSTNDVPMIPLHICLDVQAAARAATFYVATGTCARAGSHRRNRWRTTLNGEGLQHEDGHSHVLASTIPNCVSCDPTFTCEVGIVIVREGIHRI